MKTALVTALLTVAGGESYLPLPEGGRWTYAVEEQSADAAQSLSVVVTEVSGTKAIGDADWVEVKSFLGYSTAYVRVTGEKVELRLDSSETAPILTLLQLPPREGDQWKGTLGREEVTFTAGAPERVEVGDRMAKAVRVHFTVANEARHSGHAPTHGDLWFEAGTGIVRAQLTQDLDCHSGTTTVYRLKR